MSEKLPKLEVPEGVTDIEEYRKYLAFKNSAIIKNVIYIASDGTEVNFGAMPKYVDAKIAHLSLEEQEIVRDKKKQLNSILMKMNAAKGRAYGTKGRPKTAKPEKTKNPLEVDIIELLGRMFTPMEVLQILGEEYEENTTIEYVKEIQKQNLGEIERKRAEFRNKVDDVRLYNKRSRLEELTWMYSQVKERYIILRTDAPYNAMLRTLEQIRKEAEGDVISFNGSMDINVEVTIQNHMQKELLKKLPLMEIILARTSARMGYNPVKFIAGLHNSFYSKFITINPDFDPEAEMVYPSAFQYDFDKIEQQHKNKVEDVMAEDVTDLEEVQAQNIKDMWTKKIKESQEAEVTRIAQAKMLGEQNAKPVETEPKPIYRGKGSGKDKLLPSQTAEGKRKALKIKLKKKE